MSIFFFVSGFSEIHDRILVVPAYFKILIQSQHTTDFTISEYAAFFRYIYRHVFINIISSIIL